MRSPLLAAGTCAVIAAALTSCSAAGPDPAPAPTTTASAVAPPAPASPLAAPPTSSTPASAAPSPTFTATHDAAGVEAFTRYFFQQVETAYATGDPGLITAVSSPECQSCLDFSEDIEEVSRAGHRVQGVTLSLTDVAPVVTDFGGAATFLLDESASTTVDAGDNVVERVPAPAPSSLLMVMSITDGHWSAREIGPPHAPA